jgi:hypothetical protein
VTMADIEKEIEAKSAVENYNKVVEAAELLAVNLVEIAMSVKPSYFSYSIAELKLVYTVEVDKVLSDDNMNSAMAMVNFEVKSKHGKTKHLVCKAQYMVAYTGLKGCETTEVDKFISRVAIFACYPYFRAVFANLNWSAGTNLPPLPIYKEPIVPKPNKTK